MIATRLALVPKGLLLNSTRNSGGHLQWKGKNLFFDTSNHRVLALKFAAFFAVPFWLPFLCLRYQLNKS